MMIISGLIGDLKEDRNEVKALNKSLKAQLKKKNKRIKALLEQVAAATTEPSAAQALMIMSRGP